MFYRSSGGQGTFGHPDPMQIPQNIGDIRGAVGQYGNLPGGMGAERFKSLGITPPTTPGYGPFETPNAFSKFWQGVQAPIPEFNSGPRMASFGEPTMNEGFSYKPSMAEEEALG